MLLASPVSFPYNVVNDVIPTAPFGVTVTASGTAHVMGTWVSILSTITYDLYIVKVSLTEANTVVTLEHVLVNLGIGPDASNVTIVAEFLLGSMAGSITAQPGGERTYYAPLFIPAGTQLWAQCQSSIVSNTIVVNAQGWGGPDVPASFPVVHKWVAEGENAAGSNGTAITPGNGAQGAYAQMTASAAFDYCGVMMAHASGDTTMSALTTTGSVGIGAATEQDLGQCYIAHTSSNEIIWSNSDPILADIPAGTRIACRMCGSAAADATQTAIAYGLAY